MTTRVDITIAKLLKEKGFKEPTLAYRQKSAVIGDETILPLVRAQGSPHNWNDYSIAVPYYSIPTIAEVLTWLHNKHWIQLFLDYTYHDGVFYYGVKWVKSNGDYGEVWQENEDIDGCRSWAEAYAAAIEYTLNNLV